MRDKQEVPNVNPNNKSCTSPIINTDDQVIKSGLFIIQKMQVIIPSKGVIKLISYGTNGSTLKKVKNKDIIRGINE